MTIDDLGACSCSSCAAHGLSLADPLLKLCTATLKYLPTRSQHVHSHVRLIIFRKLGGGLGD